MIRTPAMLGLLLWATRALAAGDPLECMSTITPPPAFQARVLASIDMAKQNYAPRTEGLDLYAKLNLKAAKTRWTCSARHPHCCEDIPLAVLPVSTGGPQSNCKSSVVFPYAELKIVKKAQTGKRAPTEVTWKLLQTGLPETVEFGTKGIEITAQRLQIPNPIGGAIDLPLPVPTGTCTLVPGSTVRFQCDSPAQTRGIADHLANVYPAGHVDDRAFWCSNIDPTIISTD